MKQFNFQIKRYQSKFRNMNIENSKKFSRGGRHGYNLRVKKSYWLTESGNGHETDCGIKPKGKTVRNECSKNGKINSMNDKQQGQQSKVLRKSNRIHNENIYETDSDRKRKGSKMNGPPKKRIKTDDLSNVDNPQQSTSHINESKSSNGSNNEQQRTDLDQCNCTNDVDGRKSMRTTVVTNKILFDDTESIGSEYDRERSFISSLFQDIDSVRSDITNVSENMSYPDLFSIFDDIVSEDDEDRVIITEIFDDEDEECPKKFAK